MRRSFEETIAFHCAPVLAGLKPAGLVSCRPFSRDGWENEVDRFNKALNSFGLFFKPLCRCESGMLLLVYRPRKLSEHLSNRTTRRFLQKMGYPAGGLEGVLRHLERRVRELPEFPHEMGVMLGYPLEDVVGFMENQGRDCKLCGYWKVYSDVERAREMFEEMTRCRETVLARLAGGMSIVQILGAAS